MLISKIINGEYVCTIKKANNVYHSPIFLSPKSNNIKAAEAFLQQKLALCSILLLPLLAL